MFSGINVFSKNVALIWHESEHRRQCFTYENIVASSKDVTEMIAEIFNYPDLTCSISGSVIALLFEHSPAIVPLIIGILNCDAAFCFINPNDSPNEIESALNDFGANILIVRRGILDTSQANIRCLKECTVAGEQILILKHLAITVFKQDSIQEFNNSSHIQNSERIMFCCRTSGSTGRPKVIRVPYRCFMPNVTSLTEHLSITSNDVIYISSVPTFDPFVLDFCLALTNGATILMVSNSLRLSPHLLIDVLFFSIKPSASIIQITPSLFQRWNLNEIQNIFNTSTSLRILILGGEPFPSISTISKWQNWNCCPRKRVFNIYGLTEISCWSSLYEVQESDIKLKKRIPIGEAIDSDIKFHIKDSDLFGVGELVIESRKRKCFTESVSPNFGVASFLSTGDLVEKKQNSESIFYVSRLDNVIKRFGKLVHLKNIEMRAMSMEDVQEAYCTYDSESNWLFLFVRSTNDLERDLLDIFHRYAPSHEIPDKILILDEFPLSHHGKISKLKLLSIHRQHFFNQFKLKMPEPHEVFISKLNYTLATEFNSRLVEDDSDNLAKKLKMSLDFSFTQLGGTSFLALNLSSDIETLFGMHFQNLMPYLLDRNVSIRDIFLYLKKININVQPDTRKQENIGTLCLNWSIDLKKCIDATPTICTVNKQKIVSIGSHSGIVINADLWNGTKMSQLQLPDRIESTVSQHDEHGIVGCHDGHLYCFELLNGKVKWKFNANGIIKCKPLIQQGAVIFGNYNANSNIWCVDLKTGELLWSAKFGSKSIYSAPCKLNDDCCVVCALDGTIGKIISSTGNVSWKIQLSSPIFSSPCVLTNLNKFIIAEVIGIIHCFNYDGNRVWSFNADGNIYSSFELLSMENNNILIFFGCYDHNIYCLLMKSQDSTIKLQWKFSLLDSVFSTPKLYKTENNTNVLISCSTSGTICIIDAIHGSFIRRFKVNGDVFSTPITSDHRLIICCRDNFMYNFDLE